MVILADTRSESYFSPKLPPNFVLTFPKKSKAQIEKEKKELMARLERESPIDYPIGKTKKKVRGKKTN